MVGLAPLRAEAPARARSARVVLADGARTTIHASVHDARTTELRVAVLAGQAPLEAWCRARGVEEAIVGGFFVRPHGTPLGEVRTHGVVRPHVPFTAPWHRVRACVHVDGGAARIAPRDALPAHPRGDLLQAGPMLVRDGIPVFDRAADAEGFSAASAQFDSDITAERHPRAAIGLCGERIVAVACDGRAPGEAGLTLEELATVMAGLGCREAMNLDGGGSTSLVSGGRLCNVPRSSFDAPEPGGRAVSTALVLAPRAPGRRA